MLSFEYDENKSQSNLEKHGIDFVEAQQLWDDENFIEIPARTQEEQRFIVIAKLKAKHWSGVITYRDRAIRIISGSRSRTEEVALYESSRI
ncbi:MAG: BrnT family toxin [Hormoscilla sp. GUM202]|nr:BrnT family toxin [Hormoscilla sp. GUM202]